MNTNKSFRDVLAYRGRVMLFTPNVDVALRFERCAERHFATVVCARGWPDMGVPLTRWNALCREREYAVLSLSQQRHCVGWQAPATHIVWVGEVTTATMPSFEQAMARGTSVDMEVRLYRIREDQL